MMIDHRGAAAWAGKRALAVALCVAAWLIAAPRHLQAAPKQNVGLVGQGITLFLPDPKHHGWMLWKIWARSGSGNFASGRVTAEGVTALLFTSGKPDARMTAPQAIGDTNAKTIVASGGVTYVSLTQKGTYFRARTVTWNADTKRGVARGDVHYHNGKNGLTADAPTLYFNSGLRTVSSEPLGGGR